MRRTALLPAGSVVVCRWHWLRRVWAVEHGTETLYRSEVALRDASRLDGEETAIRGVICPRRELQTVKGWSPFGFEAHALLAGTQEPRVRFSVS